MKIFLGTILCLLCLTFCGIRIYKNIIFNINCGGRLKRAADANTTELAKEELKAAIEYAQSCNLISGYTSILYRTPDEDVGFWYRNITNSLNELESLRPDATQLERSNLLMKLRETLLDTGEKKMSVTVPKGISIYPNNVGYFIWGLISFIEGLGGVILIVWKINEY